MCQFLLFSLSFILRYLILKVLMAKMKVNYKKKKVYLCLIYLQKFVNNDEDIILIFKYKLNIPS